MNTQDEKSHSASYGKKSSLPDSEWTKLFPEEKREELFDLITSMFLDSADEKHIAEALSEHYNVTLTAGNVRNIRVEAARKADTIEEPEKRKKWVFRYRYLTLNNLVKEYIFITGLSGFFEAKIELADEFFWLEKKYSKKRLWIAVNDALGRNNVPVELVDELLEFREDFVRIKQLLTSHAKAQGINVMALILELSKKVADAYRKKCQENSVKTAQHMCDLLEMEPGTVTPSDIEFFLEYSRCSQLPDRSESGALIGLIQGADVLGKRSLLSQAVGGNIANFSLDDIQELIQEMRLSPVLEARHLEKLRDYASKRRRERGAAAGIFKILETLAENHLALKDINKFYSQVEFLKTRVKRISLSELQKTLDILNALKKFDEVKSWLGMVIESSPYKEIMTSFADKYCAKRFPGKST